MVRLWKIQVLKAAATTTRTFRIMGESDKENNKPEVPTKEKVSSLCWQYIKLMPCQVQELPAKHHAALPPPAPDFNHPKWTCYSGAKVLNMLVDTINTSMNMLISQSGLVNPLSGALPHAPIHTICWPVGIVGCEYWCHKIPRKPLLAYEE